MNNKHFFTAVILIVFLAVGIQSANATIYLTPTGWEKENGDPLPQSDYGWEQTSLTATLKTDVTETIIILNPWYDGISEDDRITLLGGEHTISGVAGAGVDLGLQEDINHDGSLYVTIQDLNVTGCDTGITLNPSGYCNVINNTVSDCQYGIFMSTAGTCTIEGNSISGNDFGILLQSESRFNTLNNNTIKDNNVGSLSVGLSVTSGSRNNTIYNNNFINNSQQATVYNDFNNLFNLSEGEGGGNYWSDYTGTDGNRDGFGDTPYVISEAYQVKDNLPWVIQDGWIPVADAGADQIVECTCQQGGTLVELDGSGSTGAATYTWTGNFSPSPASGATTIVTLNGCQINYVINLVVNNGQYDSEPSTVTITVEDTTPPDVIPPGDVTIEAMGPDPVPVDDERIQAFLAGVSASDNCDPEPAITNDAPAEFQPGDTVVTFTAVDASGNESTCESTVTVVEAAESNLRIIPSIINREGRLQRILAVIRFPEGTAEEDIDIGQPLVLYPGDSFDGIEATSQRIVTWSRLGTLRISIFASFSKDDVTAGVPEDGPVEMMVIGRFTDGQYFYGIDTARLISWSW